MNFVEEQPDQPFFVSTYQCVDPWIGGKILMYTKLNPKLCIVFVVCLVMFILSGCNPATKNEQGGTIVEWAYPADDQGVYHVLLIGDLITAGYVDEVRKLLGDNVLVEFIEIPKGWDRDLDALLAQIRERRAQWDLIQFNYGLDALRAGSDGEAIIPLQEYNELIVSALKSLQSVSTHLVWATTTPIQEGVEDYVVNGERLYNTNEMLTAELTALDVTTNDLWEYASIRKLDMLLEGKAEMNAIGYQMLGEVTAGKIREVLIRTYKAELPNVLILGDSISGGYKMHVMNRMLGKANVIHGNTAFTSMIDWAAIVRANVLNKEAENGKPFDVIHFNWGLHALKYIDDKGDLSTSMQGTQAVPIDRYEIELEKLVTELKKTKATLIWAMTTPTHPKTKWSVLGDELKYNEVAKKIMQKHGILINDLHRTVNERMATDEAKYKNGVHYTTEGSDILAEQISQTLLRLINIEPGSTEEQAHMNDWGTTAQEELPILLILGDSISIGYTPFVKEALQGQVNVYRSVKADGSPENSGDSGVGLTKLDRWLGETQWDVIHFNFGLHDFKRLTPGMGVNSNDPTQPAYTSLEQYKVNIEKIVERLKKTGAILIFATTTPFPDGVIPSRIPEDSINYNKVAIEIMNKHNVIINDFYSLMLPKLTEYQLPVNVHFNKQGLQYMSEQTVKIVQQQLKQRE